MSADVETKPNQIVLHTHRSNFQYRIRKTLQCLFAGPSRKDYYSTAIKIVNESILDLSAIYLASIRNLSVNNPESTRKLSGIVLVYCYC